MRLSSVAHGPCFEYASLDPEPMFFIPGWSALCEAPDGGTAPWLEEPCTDAFPAAPLLNKGEVVG